MQTMLLIDRLDIGGAETHVVTLAKGLRARGHEVTVVSGGGEYEAILRASMPGITCVRFPVPPATARPSGLLRDALFLKGLLGQARASFVILHAHTRRTALILRLLHLCMPPSSRRTSGKAYGTIVTAHAAFRPTLRALSYWGERTIAVSDDLRRHLTDAFGVPPTRIRVISNGIDCAHFCPVWAGDTGQATKKAASERHIVFASRMDHDCAAAAFAILALCGGWREVLRGRGKELRVTLAGGGDCLDEVRRAAAALPPVLAERIHLPGAVSDMAGLYRGADVFVGVSRAALEALACGCRVVLAGNEGFGGVLNDRNFDHFAAGNFCCRGEAPLTHEALDAAVRAVLLADAATSREVAERLRARVAERYDASRMAEETERVYAEVTRG